MSEPDWDLLASEFPLRPGVTYLNHGSFGPSPRVVLEARREWLERIESDPCDFFIRQLDKALADAREQVARFVGCRADDLAFVENATTGMNIVAASFPLEPGDAVIMSDHEYGAVVRIWERACRRRQARLVWRPVPMHVGSPDEVVEALLDELPPRSRLLVFSHVTSSTAVVFPAEALCRLARERGLAVCVDGPHAIGMRPVDLQRLDCDYYTASCHKWLSGPFGSGFLYVAPRAQHAIEPVVMSWGRTPLGELNRQRTWRDEFDWVGTRDVSSYLALPAAIEFLESVGLERFRLRTHELACEARQRISSLTGMAPLTPDSLDWYGSMVALPLPRGDGPPLQQALWERAGIEVPIMTWQDRRILRVSCHVYTKPTDIDRLVDELATELASGSNP